MIRAWPIAALLIRSRGATLSKIVTETGIPEENRKTFKNNLEVPSFKEKVDDFRINQKRFEE